MKQRRKKRKALKPRQVLLIMIVLCVALFGAGRVTNAAYSGPGAFVAGHIVVAMQKGLNKVGTACYSVSTLFQSKKSLQKENEDLKNEIENLQLQLDATQDAQHELKEYKALYKTDKAYSEYEKVAADVVAKDSGNWFATFLINRGTDSGVKVGMNVIASGGLVGIVTDVGSDYAKVRSIVDDSSNVSAMDATTSDICIVSGSLKTMNQKQQIEFSDLRNSKDLKVKKGDKLVTSAISSRYLKGIPIGYITTMKTDAGELTQSGTVVPIVDFDHLEHVFVIKKVKDYSKAEE